MNVMRETRLYFLAAAAALIQPIPVLAQPPPGAPDPRTARTVLAPSTSAKVEVRIVKFRGAEDGELPADIYFNPKTKGPRATLLLISGTDDSRDWRVYKDFGRLAAERGFVAVVPAKRFPRGGEGIAQGRADTLALLEQLDRLAPDLIDRSRVCFWAFSGGGTTMSVAYGKERPELSCVIGFYPAVSLAVQAPEDWLNTYSPAHSLALHGGPTSPPTLIVRAGKDAEALNSGIADFTAKALSRNVPITLVNLPDARHAFDILDDHDWSREAMENAFEFARRWTAGKQPRGDAR